MQPAPTYVGRTLARSLHSKESHFKKCRPPSAGHPREELGSFGFARLLPRLPLSVACSIAIG